MRTVSVGVRSAICLAVGLLGVPTALGQEKTRTAAQITEPSVTRIVLLKGTARTVQYLSDTQSATEQARLRELARAENEAGLADDLLALRIQYVNNELLLDNWRTYVGDLYPGWTYTGYPWGSDGALRSEMARTLAMQATPEYARKVHGEFNAAVSRAAASSSGVRAALGISDLAETSPRGSEQPRSEVPIVLRLRVGDRIEKVAGTFVGQNRDWMVVRAQDGIRTIARSQVLDIVEPKEITKLAGRVKVPSR
jgi:hypothetical protein